MMVLPDHLFCNTLSFVGIEDKVCDVQEGHKLITQWQETFPLENTDNGWLYNSKLVVVKDNTLRREVISLYHDHRTTGHPGISKTLSALACDYWWPDMMRFTGNYVKGCVTCQATKSGITRPKVPPFPITT